MAFLIRTIDFTAAGREIIRDRVVEQTSLTIGRDGDVDVMCGLVRDEDRRFVQRARRAGRRGRSGRTAPPSAVGHPAAR